MSIYSGIREGCRRMKIMKTRFEFTGKAEDLPSSKHSDEHPSDEPGPLHMELEDSHHEHQIPVPSKNAIGMEVAGASKR